MTANTNLIPIYTNPDLQQERQTASFNLEEFQNWWHGGADKLKLKRDIEQLLYSDLDVSHLFEYLSYEHLYNSGIQLTIETATKLKELQHQRNPGGKEIWPTTLMDPVCFGHLPAGNPLLAHISMFEEVIKNQGTAEQYEKFGIPAKKGNIIGTYAQTELAHGTNVRGIETRADYDRKTAEFVLNTPSLSAYKWWPGGMGHTSNFAMVVAQLYIDGEHKGIQMFIVPIRDRETHMPLPGIDVGDIGQKLGMQAVNQGFLGLQNVRIPRTNMLMKNAKVMVDGTFVQNPVSKLTYLTMVHTRCLIVIQSSFFLSMAVTIATRYAAVRRQSPINPNEAEPQIIDHVTQQFKIFPEIATVMAFRLSFDRIWELYYETEKGINAGDYKRLPELHLLSCVLKVISTKDSSLGIEQLRLSCGGHGYLTAANFGNLYGNATAACTYEGENTVLLLQSGRYLVKAWLNLTNGKAMPPSVAYLEEVNRMGEFPKWNDSWKCMVQALQFTAANKTRIAFENLAKRVTAGETQQEAANHTGIELTQAAVLHGRQFLAATFLAQVTGFKSETRSPALNAVLENLLELFLVQTTLRNMSDILRFIPLTDDNLRSLQRRLEQVLKKLRPDAVAICDGFDYHDRVLNSVLGCYDGNVYERLFESAKKSTLNQKPVPKSFEQYLKPFMRSNL